MHGLQDATAVPWQPWLLLAPVVLVIKQEVGLHNLFGLDILNLSMNE